MPGLQRVTMKLSPLRHTLLIEVLKRTHRGGLQLPELDDLPRREDPGLRVLGRPGHRGRLGWHLGRGLLPLEVKNGECWKDWDLPVAEAL